MITFVKPTCHIAFATEGSTEESVGMVAVLLDDHRIRLEGCIDWQSPFFFSVSDALVSKIVYFHMDLLTELLLSISFRGINYHDIVFFFLANIFNSCME